MLGGSCRRTGGTPQQEATTPAASCRRLSTCGCPGRNAGPVLEQRWPRSAAAQEQSYSAFAEMAFQGGLVCSHKNQRADSSKCLLVAWKPKSFSLQAGGSLGATSPACDHAVPEREDEPGCLHKRHLNFSVLLLQITPLGGPRVVFLKFDTSPGDSGPEPKRQEPVQELKVTAPVREAGASPGT